MSTKRKFNVKVIVDAEGDKKINLSKERTHGLHWNKGKLCFK